MGRRDPQIRAVHGQAKRTVSRAEPLDAILAVARDLAASAPDIRLYGFGSYFRGAAGFSDIDVLAVCPHDAQADLARSAMRDLCATWPIDLLILTAAEAEETDFLAKQGCSPLR